MSPQEYKTIVFISFVVIVLVVYFIRKELENKRKKQIEDYSKNNGIEYSGLKLDFLPEITKEGSILLSKNGENNAIALMSGEKNGFKYCLFDYSDNTKSGRGSSTVKTICIISKENIKFPHFYIRDESILYDHIIDSKAGEDINFTEDSEFSNKFILFGASEEKVREFFDKGRRDAFVKKHVKGYIYEGFKNCFIVSNDNKLLNLKERLVFLDKCFDIFRDIVPDDDIIEDVHQKN